ncbi:interleukin-12 receptor subunit beta-1 [Paroedura picta]|uniref:interleukin-12 receptor subunit beta-1 n=1 Tax=Paroedura picta TaxID=143630 RepID=UPI004055BCDD
MQGTWWGRRLLLRHLLLLLLLLLCFAVLGTPDGLDALGSHGLLCSKKSCTDRMILCRWKAANVSKANYILHLRYPGDPRRNRSFPAGEATSFSFDENRVSSVKNVTIWVENLAEGSVLISKKLQLKLSQAVKFEAPTGINVSKVNGSLTLKWPRPSRDCPPFEKEARMRHNSTGEKWTLGNCDSREEKGDSSTGWKLIVLCRVEKSVRHEVQIRQRTSHWSSTWSEWSKPLVVPAEIIASPKVTYIVGQLGSDGLRNVTLEWEKASREQGEVNYTLTFVLLPCDCPDAPSRVDSCSNSCQIRLSGAAYSVSLQASNAAGRAPPFVFHLPPAGPDPAPDLLSLHSPLSAGHPWAGKTDAEAYCFEEQPLGEALHRQPCTREAPNMLMGRHAGTLEPNRCYRLAVHALDSQTCLWSTVVFTHFFSRNTSLEEALVVRVTNETTDSAVLGWEPPGALVACPNTLKKYIVCWRDKQAGNVAYHEANSWDTHYTILGLQPQTAYQVGVWPSTDEADESCQPLWPLLTRPRVPKSANSSLGLWYVGIFGGLLTATLVFCFGKKRAKEGLCSALPDPANTEAVQLTSISGAAQVQLKLGFIELLEPDGPAEPLLVEWPPKEGSSAKTTVDPLGAAKPVEEFPPPTEDPASCPTALPLEYNSQGLLSPVDEEGDQGQEGRGGFTGISSVVRAGHGPLLPQEAEVGDRTALPQAAAPRSLTLLDTVVVSRDSAGGCGFSAST